MEVNKKTSESSSKKKRPAVKNNPPLGIYKSSNEVKTISDEIDEFTKQLMR